MIDRDILKEAHEREIINKKDVLWWQLGFEGRRIYSQEEFNNNLEEISYDVEEGFFNKNAKKGDLIKKRFKIWTKDEVPILIKEVDFNGLKLPVFVTVKPMSHLDPIRDGWNSLKGSKEYKMPMSAFHEPHIRGTVIEATDEFLFWHPISLGMRPSFYETKAFRLKNEKLLCLVNPVHPTKFYKNLIKPDNCYGRLAQKKYNWMNCSKARLEIIPYYEASNEWGQIFVYPAPFLKNGLDSPALIISFPNKEREIIGVGGFSENSAFYLKLNKKQKEEIRKSLISKLNN